MANDGKVVIELVGKDSATQVFVKTFQDMQQAFHRLEGQNASLARSMAGTESSLSFLSGLPGLFLKIAGSIVSAYGAWNLFKKGLESADQFRVSTIGIGAALTNMAAPGQGSFEQLFQRNLDYAKQMYAAIEEEAAKHFAGPEDIMRGYNQLVQQGYNVRMEEVGALGLLVDKIKLATQGQNTEVQINQEIRALMEGQANAHSAIARELQTRLGPAWKDIVQQHKESGDLLQYLASLWPGISAATKEVQDTLTSQKTTLMGHLAFLGREGLGGAYDDIVGLMKEINGYLKEHGHELAGEIAAGWQDVKTLISEAYNFVYGIKEITKEAIRVEVQVFTTWVGDPIAQWFIKNHLPNLQKSDFGKSWNNFRNLPGGPGDPNHTDTGWINDFSGYEQPMPKDFWNARSGPPPKTIAPAHDDGGKGAKGAADDLQKELDKLRKEAETSRKDALDTLNESYRVVFEVGSSFAKLREDQIKLVQEATKETSTLWQAVMGDERLSYQERLSAANNYKDAHIKVINDEINAIQEKYGALVTGDTLEAYRKSQFDHLNKQIQSTVNPEAFSWESAWKKAAENVQSSLSDTIFALVTQSKNAGDVLTNISNGIFKVISEMASQSILQVARTAMDSANLTGGGGGGGGLLSSIGNFFSGLLGGGNNAPVGAIGAGKYFHSGGIVVAHNGLAPDEIPAILQTGERVLSRGENRDYERGGGWNITIVNKTSAPIGKATVERGGTSRDLIVTLDETVAQLIQGNGQTAQAMDRRYGAQPGITVRG